MQRKIKTKQTFKNRNNKSIKGIFMKSNVFQHVISDNIYKTIPEICKLLQFISRNKIKY